MDHAEKDVGWLSERIHTCISLPLVCLTKLQNVLESFLTQTRRTLHKKWMHLLRVLCSVVRPILGGARLFCTLQSSLCGAIWVILLPEVHQELVN